ncbi:MAG TPA: hypothetical protein VHV30_11290 [Polyangiaceae bacterium]|nr:hypothetical protein [Polyangiaceae bacterium]
MHRTARILFLFSILATGCSSSSSGAPTSTGSTDAGDDATSSANDGSSSPTVDATAEASEPEMEAAPAPVCDAVSLAIMDGGLVPCFQCQATMCAALITACSTDCLCAPAYNCLQLNSAQGINSGYSSCPGAIDAISNSDPGLTLLAHCATTMCNAQCNPQTTP